MREIGAEIKPSRTCIIIDKHKVSKLIPRRLESSVSELSSE